VKNTARTCLRPYLLTLVPAHACTLVLRGGKVVVVMNAVERAVVLIPHCAQ